ncbi:MAG: hypothetical protein MJB14_19540, partial [Spirochaetes bacterium]|nr:hypothetical protein [Spirochaetota bacterium]
MQKAIIYFFIFLVCSFSLVSDTTNDINKIRFREKSDTIFKFRGNIQLFFGYYPTDDNRINRNEIGGFDLRLALTYDFIAPFFTTQNPIMKNNNIKFRIYSDVSPITMNSGLGVILTFTGLLKLETAFLIGSGWNFMSNTGTGVNDQGNIQAYDFHGV